MAAWQPKKHASQIKHSTKTGKLEEIKVSELSWGRSIEFMASVS
jgi:hypothetical protein